MPNGNIGDHPLTDILIHGRRVYSEHADNLVREIVALGGKKLIADMLIHDYNDLAKPKVSKLEVVLTEIRDRLKEDAKSRGWEV